MSKENYNYNSASRKRFSLVERLERAKDIWELKTTKGLTLEAIGDMKGLTKERIRQILFWYKQFNSKNI